ncbi:hypothetical protein [Vallitalea sp.]|uniref:hypothetical protein n=1 Tax=Vallitalea sp. TaxID=1882829 RepID=UPI0025E7B849|nr:hypothetical protein [Vallitalea sp.]MCT4686202.1 hypothetical protein [Vallitalea sp.]
MSKDFNNPTRININNPYVGNLATYGDNWFYTEFQQSGKATFEVVPSSGLSVNLYIYDRNNNTLAISTSGGEGQAERIEYNVSVGQWIRMDVQYSSGSGSFTLSCKMKSGGSVTPNAKEIKDNDYNPPVNISKGQEHWYYVRFDKDGKANFFVEPLNSQLDVDITVYKGSTTGEVVGQSSKGPGQWDLVEKKPVQAGIKYYIKIKGYSGSGQYKVRCKNYTQILSDNEIDSYVRNNNLTSIQKNALDRVNTYANNDKIKTAIAKNRPLIFFFEGAGLNSNTKYNKENGRSKYSIDRYGAIALVIKNNKIIFFTDQASTLPDRPKGTKYDIPTVVDGVYNINSHLHQGEYPAFKINSPKVIRFGNTNWYDSSSSGINIHAGYNTYKYNTAKDGLEGSWSNSEGCQLLSMRNTVRKNITSSKCLCFDPNGTDSGIYHEFVKSIGLVNSNIFSSNGVVINKNMNVIRGTVIIDREYVDTHNTTLQSLYGVDGLKYMRKGVK